MESVGSSPVSPDDQVTEEARMNALELGQADVVNESDENLHLENSLSTKLVESKFDMEVQTLADDASQNFVSTFEELNIPPELLKGLDEMGFNTPSKFQRIALPTLLSEPPQNMIAQFQCGMGKTTAFVLASLCRVHPENQYPQVLVLSPTYDLAIQTGQIARQLTKCCPEIKILVAVKGKDPVLGRKVKAHVVIGTPTKVLDWTSRNHFFDIKKITVFVLDEADIMLDNRGHQDQATRIHRSLSKSCQKMLFLPTYKKHVMEFAEHIIQNPVVICLRKEEYLDNIKQYYVVCRNDDEKFNAISNIYGVIAIGQTICFCHTRKTAIWLVEKMIKNGHAVGFLSGDMTVEQRISVLSHFRKGKAEVMVTTDVCARALWKWYPYKAIEDEQVSIVVNFDLPLHQKRFADCEIYLHRIGRTGYFKKSGLVINMVEGKANMDLLKQIEHHFAHQIHKLDANDPDDIEKLVQE